MSGEIKDRELGPQPTAGDYRQAYEIATAGSLDREINRSRAGDSSTPGFTLVEEVELLAGFIAGVRDSVDRAFSGPSAPSGS